MNNKYKRGTNYRKTFFKYKKGLFGLNLYHCAYCGKFLTQKRLTVDHLIPVNKVKYRGIGRIIMKLSGVKNINDINNLVASCKHCNSKKSDKMGFWLIRGYVGQYFVFWLIIWIVLLACIIYILKNNSNEIISFINAL